MTIEVRPFTLADQAAVIQLWTACDLVVPWNDPLRDMERKLRVQPELFRSVAPGGYFPDPRLPRPPPLADSSQ